MAGLIRFTQTSRTVFLTLVCTHTNTKCITAKTCEGFQRVKVCRNPDGSVHASSDQDTRHKFTTEQLKSSASLYQWPRRQDQNIFSLVNCETCLNKGITFLL